MKNSPEPIKILENKRLIQSQFMAECINFYLADNNILISGDHLAYRITRCEHDQTKSNETDAEKNKYHLSQSHQNLFFSHKIPPNMQKRHEIEKIYLFMSPGFYLAKVKST